MLGGAVLVAGALLALTPVAALMFRFDNPDAMLVLLMTLAAYAVVRALDATGAAGSPRTRSALRWMVLAGALVGVLLFAAASICAELNPVPLDESASRSVSLAFIFLLASQVLFGWE